MRVGTESGAEKLINGRPVEMDREQDLIFLVLKAASQQEPSRFEVAW